MDPLILVGLPLLPVALILWMRRRHPDVPRGWQLSQSEAAILHRRLHRCVDETRRAVARAGNGVPVEQLKSLTEDLNDQAVAIDRKLVDASRLPSKARHKSLLELKYRIIETEQLAARVRELAVDMARPHVDETDGGIQQLRDRLDALDQARREAFDIGRTPRPPDLGREEPDAS
jgi:chemotaxis regulatin CheY-phosphate phosphatase CheZ